MSEQLANNEIRDTNTYRFNTDSGAVQGIQLFHFVNNLDAEVTIEVYGTRDEDRETFTDAESLGTVVVSASSTGYETMSDPWEEVEFQLTASTAPTSGSIEIYEMK